MREERLLDRLDKIQMSTSDRVAARAYVIQAERLADVLLTVASGVQKWVGTLAVAPIRRGVALIRSSFANFGLLP